MGYTEPPRVSVGNFVCRANDVAVWVRVLAFKSRTSKSPCAALVFHIQARHASTYSVFQHSALPQVSPVYHMLPADLTYYEAHSYTVSLRSTVFCYNHHVPSPGVYLSVCLVVNVCCVLTMCFKLGSVGSELDLLTLFQLVPSL